MRLVGAISSYNEGSLLRECIRSLLRGVEFVYLYEGPFGEGAKKDEEANKALTQLLRDCGDLRTNEKLFVRYGSWQNQAAKLTEMTQSIVSRVGHGEAVWIMHLDGDEVLLWPEMLRDIVERFWEELPDERYMNIKLVELDGTVGGTQTHLIRGDLIERYMVSGSQIWFKGDLMPVALHNPDGDRFPIQGEPHILHRSPLRKSGRDAPELRAHLSEEAKWFDDTTARLGL